MNLFFSRSIIFLLFLLQGLSPLVHAHVQADGGEYGLHIDGISVLAEKNAQFTSLESIGHSDAVIDMRSAVQQKKLLVSNPDNGVSASAPCFVKSLFIEKLLQFSLPAFQKKLSISLSIIAPRAPPASTFI